MDEATRFKSAFAMASSMNVTTKQIMDSADFYLQILGQEEQKFNKALKAFLDMRGALRKLKLESLPTSFLGAK